MMIHSKKELLLISILFIIYMIYSIYKWRCAVKEIDEQYKEDIDE